MEITPPPPAAAAVVTTLKASTIPHALLAISLRFIDTLRSSH
jgi:hypothetical protein